MSVINRIEVANLLNKHGDIQTPWEAKMRHLLLDLKGQSTAVSMENGFGKTTLSEALIGLLARDRKLLSNTRRKCCPAVKGSYSHLRVEFLLRHANPGQDDLLASHGSAVAGEPWVFGLYGHSDSELQFYFYPGQLEDCPVHYISRDQKRVLHPNQDFQRLMRDAHVHKPATRDEWLDEISRHISRKELEQLATFQKEGGADKSQIFNAIRPKRGEKADQAFFYEVLAPQILAGATQGETDEAEEFIEDVVVNSGRHVSELRHRLGEARQDLERAERKVTALDQLRYQADDWLNKQQALDERNAQLARDAAVLQHFVQSRRLPGIPLWREDATNDVVFAQSMAWAPGEREPLIELQGLATLCGLKAKILSDYFDQVGVHPLTTRRLVMDADTASEQQRQVRWYQVSRVRVLLHDMHQSFSSDADRLAALERLDQAWEMFLDADTNPFREQWEADRVWRHQLQEDLQTSEQHLEAQRLEVESLERRHREFTDNQTYYTDALAQGLFSEAELNAPDDTAQSVATEAAQARQALADHHQQMGQWRHWDAEWQHFRRLEPERRPQDVLADDDQRQAQYQKQIQDIKNQLHTLEHQRAPLQQQLAQAQREQDRLQPQRDELEQLATAHQTFKQWHPSAVACGFLQQAQAALQSLQTQYQQLTESLAQDRQDYDALRRLMTVEADYQRLHGDDKPVSLRDRLLGEVRALQSERAQLEPQQQQCQAQVIALEGFQQRVPDQDPDQWCAYAQSVYPQWLQRLDQLQQSLNRLNEHLAHLEQDPLMPSAQEQEALALLQAEGLDAIPLHQCLKLLLHDASEAERRDVMTQAAALLFAPVLADDDQASKAAGRLLDSGLNIPVLSQTEISSLWQSGQPLLGAVIGQATLAVKAASDPTYLAQLREQLESKQSALKDEYRRLQAELATVEPHGELFRLAQSAQLAVRDNASAQLIALQQRQEELDEALSRLNERTTDTGLQLIQDYQRFLSLGGAQRYHQLGEQLAEADMTLSALSEQIEIQRAPLQQSQRVYFDAERYEQLGGATQQEALTAEHASGADQVAMLEQQLAELEVLLDEQQQLLAQLNHDADALLSAQERERLQQLAAYCADDGPAFMANAQAREAVLSEAVTRAQQRANYPLQRIREYLAVRDEGGLQGRREQVIATARSEVTVLQQQLKQQRQQLEALNERIEKAREATRWVDELAVEWLAQCRELTTDLRQSAVQQFALADLDEHPLLPLLKDYLAALSAHAEGDAAVDAVDSVDESALQLLQQQIQDLLHDTRVAEQGQQLQHLHQETHKARLGLLKSLQALLEKSSLLNASEKARLDTWQQADGDLLKMPEALARLRHTLHDQLKTHQERVEELLNSSAQVESGLQERLARIIIDAAGNLELLRRVARATADRDKGAWFDIQADVIEDDEITALVEQLLGDIEARHAHWQQRQAEGDDAREDQLQRDLQHEVRQRIYRGLFKSVAIRVRHPAIRPHGRLFSLNEQMSEGQREAISLMWLVKLSEFAIERDLRGYAVPTRQREQAGRESVIVLDGLFSKLSHRRLIQDSLESLRHTRGRFQMIGLIHNPNYENDADIFPTYLVGSVIGGVGGQGGHVLVHQGQAMPEAMQQQAGEASLFHLYVERPENKTSTQPTD